MDIIKANNWLHRFSIFNAIPRYSRIEIGFIRRRGKCLNIIIIYSNVQFWLA